MNLDTWLEMALLSLGRVAFVLAIITLQSKNLLARHKQCACGAMMELQDRDNISDGCGW